MTSAVIEQRLRLFLLVLATFLCVGTPVELWLTDHTKQTIQLVPFGLCVLGLLALLAVLFRPSRASLLALRVAMVPVGLGALIGVYEHFDANWEFALELNPKASTVSLFWTSLHGASPMLAPGILALTAVLALAATYYHPLLNARLVALAK
jgi:hypothetical protein